MIGLSLYLLKFKNKDYKYYFGFILLLGFLLKFLFPFADLTETAFLGVSHVDELWMEDSRNKLLFGEWNFKNDKFPTISI